MFKRLLYLALPAVVLFAACKRVKSLADISFVVPFSAESELPKLGGAGTPLPGGIRLSLPTMGVETKADSFMQEYRTTAENLRAAILRELSMKLLTPENGSFNFVDSIDVYLSAHGLPEKLAAYKYGILPTDDSVAMDCIADNLKEYFLKDSMFIRLDCHFTAIPDTAIKLRLNSRFGVTANPLY